MDREESFPRSDEPTQESSQRVPSLDVENKDRAAIPIILIALLLITTLATLFIIGAFDENEKVINPVVVNDVILIPEGTVQEGLSGEARALLLLACERSKKNGESCEESKFLEGEIADDTHHVPAFNIDKYEVSNFEFQKCVKSGQCQESKRCEIYTPEGKQFGSRPPKILLQPSHPVVCVSQKMANDYCVAKGGVLPTKVQFLRAARRSDRRVFAWGNHWDPELANWAERDLVGTPILGKVDGYGFSAPVGTFDEGCSPFGVCGLSGNVGEWSKMSRDTSFYRSGGWTDSPFDLRITREREAKNARTDVGFRCVYETIRPAI